MTFRLFPSFFDCPKCINFKEQENDEHIELFLRRHWVTNIPWILTTLIGFLLPIIIIQADQTAQTSYLNNLSWQEITAAIVIWYMLLAAFAIERFLNWYFNVYIVTNQNLLDINFYSLLFRNIVEINLRNIESQSSAIQGVSGSFFNFGRVTIESAAKDEDVVFEAVPYPDIVADRIQDLRMKLGKGGKKA